MSGTWAAGRQPASFRGVPFVILENNMRRGRQVAMHVYPFRDDVWPEDMGRSPRITSFRGFVVGDDCDQQIEDLGLAVQMPGPGQLVHPTLGAMSVQVLSFNANDTASAGRMWSFEMSVVPAIGRIYPVITADTQSQTQSWLQSTGAAISADFAAVQAQVNSVRASALAVVQTGQSYAAQAQNLVHDATSLVHFPASLVGNFGRFAGGHVAFNLPGLSTLAIASGRINGALSSVSRISGTISGLAARL